MDALFLTKLIIIIHVHVVTAEILGFRDGQSLSRANLGTFYQ